MALASLVLLHLLVRVDARAAVKPAMMAGIAAEARRIWTPYGVDLTFAAAGSAAASGPEGEAIQLVITDQVLPGPSPRRAGDVAGIGWIEFTGPGEPARAITVSTTAASRLADQAVWAGRSLDLLPPAIREQFLVRALGRAAAHEIGHYLLRSTAHTRAGLMRAQFPAGDIMDGRLSPFRLEPAEVEMLNRRQPGALQASIPVASAVSP